ncbi:hypothetical protein AB6C61_08255 [Vibrio splendidus]
MIGFIERNEKFLNVVLSLIQTIVIVISIWFVYFDLKGKESEGFQNQQKESWNLYQDNKGTTLALRQFWQSLAFNPNDEELISAVTRYYVPIQYDASEMYTAFEMCLKVGSCDEEILLELACDDAISVSRLLYQDFGEVMFDGYDENLTSELHFNMYHFTGRCSKRSHHPSSFKWLDRYNNLIIKNKNNLQSR